MNQGPQETKSPSKTKRLFVPRKEILEMIEKEDHPWIVRGTKKLAIILDTPKKTLDGWLLAGAFRDCYRKRGKHNVFWVRRVLHEYLNGPDWNLHDKTVSDN